MTKILSCYKVYLASRWTICNATFQAFLGANPAGSKEGRYDDKRYDGRYESLNIESRYLTDEGLFVYRARLAQFRRLAALFGLAILGISLFYRP